MVLEDLIIMKKYDLDFVQKNLPRIKRYAIANAKRLYKEATILFINRCHCRALFLYIVALEELAKYSILSTKPLHEEVLARAVNHKMKCDELVKVINTYFLKNYKKKDIEYLKNNRLVELREDSLYVRLKSREKDGKGYPPYPRNSYCLKRLIVIRSTAMGILKHINS